VKCVAVFLSIHFFRGILAVFSLFEVHEEGVGNSQCGRKIVVGSNQNFVTLDLPLLLDSQPHLDNHRQHKHKQEGTAHIDLSPSPSLQNLERYLPTIIMVLAKSKNAVGLGNRFASLFTNMNMDTC